MILATGALLPKALLIGAAIYGGFTALYALQAQLPLAIVTAITAVLFVGLSRMRRQSLAQIQFAVAVIVVLVTSNVAAEYVWSRQYLHGLGFVLSVIAAGVLMPTLMWWLVHVVLSLAAWTVVTLALQIQIDLFEASLALFASTVVGALMLFMRVRMTALAESLRLSLEATRDRELREILDGNADPTLIHRDGLVVYVNRAFTAMLAAEPGQLVGRKITDLTSQASLDRFAEVLEARELSSVRTAGGPPTLGPSPITLTRCDRTSVTMELAEPRTIWFEGGAATLWSGREISATQQALHARLLDADRMAVAGSLAAGLAHEINNPLTVVRLNLALLATAAPAELPELVDELTSSVGRIERIVGDLAVLSPARADAIEDVEVDRALHQAVQLASNELRHRAEVEVQSGPTPAVRIVRSKLTQALVNVLIHLARQLDGAPGQRLIVKNLTAADGRAVIEITAPGVVLGPEARARMFEPFFTTSTDGFGGGLGLYYCHSVVTGGGGTIEVVAAERGTTVRIGFPPGKQPAAVAPQVATEHQAVRILVIDDEAAVGRAIKRLLAHCQVEVSTSGSDGIARYAALRPDLVLCDLMMPELSGPMVYENLRARFPEIDERIVFMTGGVFTPKTQSFVDTTPLPVLKKPVAVSELRTLVARYARA